jgi:hypothetical protein
MFNEGNQIHNLISSSGSGTVINYGSGSGSDFLTSYGSDSGSGFTSQKVTVPTVPVPVPQRCFRQLKEFTKIYSSGKTGTRYRYLLATVPWNCVLKLINYGTLGILRFFILKLSTSILLVSVNKTQGGNISNHVPELRPPVCIYLYEFVPITSSFPDLDREWCLQ